MIELFPSDKQPLVRQILAATLQGVVSQRLLPRVDGGRVAAVEVMINTARISDLILDAEKTEDIPKALEEGEFHDMQSFPQHLIKLVLAGVVDADIAAGASGNPHDFEIALAHAVRRRTAEDEGYIVPEGDREKLSRYYPQQKEDEPESRGLRVAGS